MEIELSNGGWGRRRTAGRLVALIGITVVAGCGGSSSSRTGSPVPTANAAPASPAAESPPETPDATLKPLPTGTSGSWPTTTPGPGAFTVTGGTLPFSLAYATQALLPDGRVLLVGVAWKEPYGDYESNMVLIYNPADGTLAATTPMRTGGACPIATVLQDGRVLVAGGVLEEDAAEIYDPATREFTATGSMLNKHGCARGILLKNGEVLIPGSAQDARVQLYSPATAKFRWGAAMLTKADDRTATLLPDGRVLFVGGALNDPTLMAGTLEVYASAELYDPATDRFTATGSLAKPRGSHAAALLADGRVLVVGGGNLKGVYNSAEIWDPATGEFAETGSLATARVEATATTLKDGRVLVAGGSNRDGEPASAELYDPATGKFSRTGSMAVGRQRPSATLLNNGCVLVTGGYGEGPYAELYWP